MPVLKSRTVSRIEISNHLPILQIPSGDLQNDGLLLEKNVHRTGTSLTKKLKYMTKNVNRDRGDYKIVDDLDNKRKSYLPLLSREIRLKNVVNQSSD